MRPVVYHIDDRDLLTDVNPAWVDFARENDGAAVMPERVIGRALWDFISDGTVREIYRRLLKKVRGGEHVQFDYRCDSPGQRREFAMAVAPLDTGAVEFVSTARHVTARHPVSLLSAAPPSAGDPFIRICSWCHAARTDASPWLPLEVALIELRLLDLEPPPRVSHGICEPCAERMFGKVGRT